MLLRIMGTTYRTTVCRRFIKASSPEKTTTPGNRSFRSGRTRHLSVDIAVATACSPMNGYHAYKQPACVALQCTEEAAFVKQHQTNRPIRRWKERAEESVRNHTGKNEHVSGIFLAHFTAGKKETPIMLITDKIVGKIHKNVIDHF